MIQALYGSFKIHNKRDWIILPLKILYIVYTLPFLLFAVLLYIRSLGGFSKTPKEEFSIIKKIMLHFSAVVISFGLWGCIIAAILQK